MHLARSKKGFFSPSLRRWLQVLTWTTRLSCSDHALGKEHCRQRKPLVQRSIGSNQPSHLMEEIQKGFLVRTEWWARARCWISSSTLVPFHLCSASRAPLILPSVFGLPTLWLRALPPLLNTLAWFLTAPRVLPKLLAPWVSPGRSQDCLSFTHWLLAPSLPIRTLLNLATGFWPFLGLLPFSSLHNN